MINIDSISFSTLSIENSSQNIDLFEIMFYNSYSMTTIYPSESLKKQISHLLDLNIYKNLSDLVRTLVFSFFIKYFENESNLDKSDKYRSLLISNNQSSLIEHSMNLMKEIPPFPKKKYHFIIFTEGIQIIESIMRIHY